MEPDTCISVVASLREEFASRFAGVRPLHGCGLQTVYRPLKLSCGRRPCPLPMELVELQCNDDLKATFYNSSPLSFFPPFYIFSQIHGACPTHRSHVWRHLRLEQLFSKMKYGKSRLRSLLSYRHFNDILLLSTSSIEPDIEILRYGKQHQPSHWFSCFAIKVYCNKIVFIHPHLVFSFITPAHELLRKVSSDPRSEKVARPCLRRTVLPGCRAKSTRFLCVNLHYSQSCSKSTTVYSCR